MQDDEAPPSRLDTIMSVIEQLLEERRGEEGVADLAKRREDIARTARFLIETYGAGALERARLLESRRQDSGFARAVRQAVEKVLAGPPPSL